MIGLPWPPQRHHLQESWPPEIQTPTTSIVWPRPISDANQKSQSRDIWLDTYSTCGVAAMACFSKEILDVEPWCSTQASIVIECKSAKRILCCPSKASKANGPLLILQHGPELLAPIIGARLPIVVVLETISWLALYAGGSAWGFGVGLGGGDGATGFYIFFSPFLWHIFLK